MVGTFALVFAGCGAIVVDAGGAGLGPIGVALAFGLVVTIMVYATGHLSGAHLNPAVTLAFAAVGRFPLRQVPAYVAGQCLAALAAALLLALLFGAGTGLGTTLPTGSAAQSIAVEVTFTAFLMFVIMAVATDARATGAAAGIAIGGAVALAALVGGPISGASLNPARSLGPALVTGNLTQIWIYLLGPILGALVGGLTYKVLRKAKAPDGSGAF